MASRASLPARALLRRNGARIPSGRATIGPAVARRPTTAMMAAPALARRHYSTQATPTPQPDLTLSRPGSTQTDAYEQVLAAVQARDFAAVAYSIDPIWLRDACPCNQCVSPSSGQKSFATSDIPGNIAIAADQSGYDAASDTWRFSWQSDIPSSSTNGPHITEFKTADLESALRRSQPTTPLLPRVARHPWDASTIAPRLRKIPYAAWLGDGTSSSDAARHRGVLELQATGLLFVTDVPREHGAVARGAERIANLQETFYGRTWDVVNKPEAENVAYTNAFLGLHQDIMYLGQPPRIQLLHCLENDAEGGESLFSDGLRAAYETLLRLPEGVLGEVLRRRVPYHYEKNGYTYRRERPLLELAKDARGDVRDAKIEKLWWSPPFQDTFRYGDGGRLATWRAGAALFQSVLEHPSSVLEMRLQPGDCVIFDNVRVLHGRRAFSRSGKRHLKGAYVAHDDYESALANVPAYLRAEYRAEEKGSAERDEVVRLMALRDWEPRPVEG